MTKTVKHLNSVIEKLEEKVKHLQVIFDNLLYIKIRELEERERESELKIEMLIRELQRSVNTKNDKKKEFQCRFCKQTFDNRNSLRDHVLANHPKTFDCTKCDKCFNFRNELEEHLKKHEMVKQFKCNLCQSEFFLEWRLKKHIKGHSESNRKFCHYFNNGKNCPFEENGCRYKHEHSDICFYGALCKNLLCQYQHMQPHPDRWTQNGGQ